MPAIRGPRRRAPASGTQFRLLSFNIERLSDLTDPDDEMRIRRRKREIQHVEARSTAAAAIILASGADVVALQEGPPERARLVQWADRYLGSGWQVAGGGRSEQRLEQYVLLRPDGAASDLRVLDDERTRTFFDANFHAWLDPYSDPVETEWTRAPLPVCFEVAGQTVQLLNIHFGSKWMANAARLAKRHHRMYLIEACAIRLRLRAEALRTHSYIREVLAADPSQPLLFAGDCNDGPTLDEVSRRLSLPWAVSPLFGSPTHVATMMRSPVGNDLAADVHFRREPPHPRAPWTLEFYDEVFGEKWVRTWIDLIGVSRAITILGGAVEHELYERHVQDVDGARVPASDHIPTTADLWLPRKR